MGEVNLITCNNFDFILLFEHGICIFLSVVMVVCLEAVCGDII